MKTQQEIEWEPFPLTRNALRKFEMRSLMWYAPKTEIMKLFLESLGFEMKERVKSREDLVSMLTKAESRLKEKENES